MKPKLALCNFMDDLTQLRQFAREHRFEGVDWSFAIDAIPQVPSEESRWVRTMAALEPLEVRYHCPFMRVDIGHEDPAQAHRAMDLFARIIRLVAKVGGRFLTIHIGLGHDTTLAFSWQVAIKNLQRLVQFGADLGVKVCLENLAWGWTSKPNLLEKLIRQTGAGITFDIGHAHACEAIQTQYYAPEDFIAPHPDRVYNAHVYHTETKGVGHLPPERIADIADRLSMLLGVGCAWWVIEIRETTGLLQTKKIIDAYLDQVINENNSCAAGRSR